MDTLLSDTEFILAFCFKMIVSIAAITMEQTVDEKSGSTWIARGNPLYGCQTVHSYHVDITFSHVDMAVVHQYCQKVPSKYHEKQLRCHSY